MQLSHDIGGGAIRQDVQEAIQKELSFRLGDGDPAGALSRKEKELLLTALNAAKLNACMGQLHSRAAVKAGATADQVLEITIAVLLLGMTRWRMAGMEAFTAAEEASKILRASPEKPKGPSGRQEEALGEDRRYIRKALNREFPDIWEKIAELAPETLDGYMQLRKSIIRIEASTGLPKKVIELAVVGWDILDGNSWGAKMHAGQAIRDGAAVQEIVELVALVMIECGVPKYKTGGLEAIEAAEDAFFKIKRE